MKKNLLLLSPFALLAAITIILLPYRVSAQENIPLTWVTSKSAAVTKALNEGKYILLLAGRTTCPNCNYMRNTVCETNTPPIEPLIRENYVPWFCHVDNSTEWHPYAPDGSFTLPLICRIDPHNPDTYMDMSTSIQNTTTFYNRLLSGIDDWDSDGMSDEWERQYGLNPLLDDASGDPDRDSLTNINEYSAGSHPNDSDTDNDVMPDGWEVQYSLNPIFNDAANDPDNDSLKNIDEYTAGTNPKNPDTDGDSMPDGWEAQYGLNPLVNDADGDPDNDGWSNLKEYLKGTRPDDSKSHPTRTMPWLPLLLENN